MITKNQLKTLVLILAGLVSTLKAQDKFSLSSLAFQNGKAIPAKYTCADKNILPSLSWNNIPQTTKSFAIIMDDPDAPMGTWVHWVIYNIPVNVTALSEGSTAAEVKANDGLNSWETKGYQGPCPPNGTHNYIFKIYALDTILSISDMSKDKLLESMKDHVIAQAQLNGTFEM